jgi:20S proteasome alpha/beta subunit
MASDSRATTRRMVEDDNVRKIWKLSDGSLVGGAGDYLAILHAVEILKIIAARGEAEFPTLKLKNVDLMFADPHGQLFWFSGGWELMKKGSYLAIGSGRLFATGAMDAGASAIEAVRIGIKRDINSGGRVRHLTLGK